MFKIPLAIQRGLSSFLLKHLLKNVTNITNDKAKIQSGNVQINTLL